MSRHFRELLEEQWVQQRFLCVGLDPDLEKLPEHLRALGAHDAILAFNRAIVDATKNIAGSYKPNTAFYEAHGDEGWTALRATVQYINEQAEAIPVIIDAKRADIGNTNLGYIDAVFEHLRGDAVTVQPYAGQAALAPFLAREEKGVIVWCRSSNEGAGEFQDLDVGGEPLYLRVARNVATQWNARGNCSLVVGATYPEELAKIRAIAPELPLLIPGIGAQGGDIEKTVDAGKNGAGTGMMIAVSRAILYASSEKDFADAARTQAQALHEAIVAAV